MCTLHYLNVWYAHRTYLDLDILSLLLLFSPVPFLYWQAQQKKWSFPEWPNIVVFLLINCLENIQTVT